MAIALVLEERRLPYCSRAPVRKATATQINKPKAHMACWKNVHIILHSLWWRDDCHRRLRCKPGQALSPCTTSSPPHGSAAGTPCSSSLAQDVPEGRKTAERTVRLRTDSPVNSVRTSRAVCQRAP